MFLADNDLNALPDNIFDGLGLTTLSLYGNRFTADTGLPNGIFDDVLDTLGTITMEATVGSRGFVVDQTVRDAHFVCPRPDADAIVAATADVSDCLRVTSAQFNAYVQTDATLSALAVSPGVLAPAFAPEVTIYTVDVANGVASVTVTSTATQAVAGAAITINGAEVTSGSASNPIDLTAGTPEVIPVLVTAADGATTLTYTVTVTRAALPVVSLEVPRIDTLAEGGGVIELVVSLDEASEGRRAGAIGQLADGAVRDAGQRDLRAGLRCFDSG